MNFFERLSRDRLLPLVTPSTADHAREAVERVAADSATVLEVALRLEGALDALRAVSGHPQVMVGVGTVLDVPQLEKALDAGAGFVVTPGFSVPIVERCLELGVPVLPGVATAGEVMAARSLGLNTVKLFPAEPLGGVGVVDAWAGPFPDMWVVPSGGVTVDNAPDYLARRTVLAVSRSLK